MKSLYYRLRFGAFLKNPNGIKLFAEEVVSAFIKRFLDFSKRKLEAINRDASRISALTQFIDTSKDSPSFPADQFEKQLSEKNMYTFVMMLLLIAEGFLNYLAFSAVLKGSGFLYVMGKIFLSVVIVYISLLAFKKLFQYILNKPEYQCETLARSVPHLVVWIAISVFFILAYIGLGVLRSQTIEGDGTSNVLTIVFTAFGILLPIVAGYFAYERGLVIGALNNTLNIQKAEKQVNKLNDRIIGNVALIKNTFRSLIQGYYARVKDFQVYKENYAIDQSLPAENIDSHFTNSMDQFAQEATSRITKSLGDYQLLEQSVSIKALLKES